MMLDGGHEIDIDAVHRNVDEADVLAFYFPLLRKTLLVDTRTTPLGSDLAARPLIRVAPMVHSSAERFESLRRMRPEFGQPESISMIPWLGRVDTMCRQGVWDRILARLTEGGAAPVLAEASLCLHELRTLEREEFRDAMTGAGYRTVWGNPGVFELSEEEEGA